MSGLMRVSSSVMVGVLLAGAGASLLAQTTTPVHPGTGGSPHVRTLWTTAGANLLIEYGRPYVKNRTIGRNLEPIAERIWRLGADEPTTLRTDVGLKFGDVSLTSGSYTLWVMTDRNGGWKLIVNDNMSVWGTDYPGEASDVGRIAMNVERLSMPTEQLTLLIKWTGEPANQSTTAPTPAPATTPATVPTAPPSTAPPAAQTTVPLAAPPGVLTTAPTTEGGILRIDWGPFRATARFTIVKAS